ncbi:hypothetical protein HDU67_008701 [Dinochytrium kinnereticum]|nr:hypothetical protein HDU67_008701 [Dinochytrium kinnereticum]
MMTIHHLSNTFGRDLFAKVVIPIFEEFKLGEAGFEIYHISHELMTDSGHRDHKGFRNGWVFANMRHAEYDLVKDVFMTPRPKSAKTPEEKVGKALGYPSRSGNTTYRYIDAGESVELRAYCVPIFEYLGMKADRDVCLDHYNGCRMAFSEIGIDLAVSID